MPRKSTKKPNFDAAAVITHDLIRILERGVMPWRKPWRGVASSAPLRHSGEAYQGVNNFLLTLKSAIHGYDSPYWMTFNQAKDMDACVRKGETASTVIYYGTAKRDDETDATTDDSNVYRFLKSYRVFNADQIDGLDDRFRADEGGSPHTSVPCAPIAHMQAFFDAIGGDVCFTGRSAYYLPARDRIYMPDISLFEKPEHFFAVWCHEYAHWTKPRHRLNRDYGHARFGNTAYAREEVTAELTSLLVGQTLGFTPHTLELSAAYLDNWLRVLKSDKTAIFKQAADAQKACDYLMAASAAGQTADTRRAA